MDRADFINKIDEVMFRAGPKRALRICEEALRSFHDDPELLRRKAQIWELVGDFAAAIAMHQVLIERDKRDLWSLERLVSCLLHEGRLDETWHYFERLRSAAPETGTYDFLLAEIVLEEGDLEGAERIVQAAKRRSLTHDQLCDYQWVQVMISQKRGDKEAELRDAITLSRLDPTDLQALSFVRNCHERCGKQTKGYWLQVEGEAPIMAIVPGRKVYYFGSFEVLADSKTEALGFIREIEPVAIPESLKVVSSLKKKQRIPAGMRKGVVFRYPSFSAEAASSPEDLPRRAIH